MLNKIEGSAILGFEAVVLHFTALLTRAYLIVDRPRRKEFSLLDEMKGIDPIILPLNDQSFKERNAYLVRGTSIILEQKKKNEGFLENQEKKFNISVGIIDPPWEKRVDLQYIFDNYPVRIKQIFLFNLDKFK